MSDRPKLATQSIVAMESLVVDASEKMLWDVLGLLKVYVQIVESELEYRRCSCGEPME